jgi:hypothetical protein
MTVFETVDLICIFVTLDIVTAHVHPERGLCGSVLSEPSLSVPRPTQLLGPPLNAPPCRVVRAVVEVRSQLTLRAPPAPARPQLDFAHH